MKDSKEKETAKLPTQASLIIKLFAAAYFIYLATSFGDVWNRYEGAELVFYMAVIAVFGIVGIGIGVLSVRDLIRGRYIDGKTDDKSKETRQNDEIK